LHKTHTRGKEEEINKSNSEPHLLYQTQNISKLYLKFFLYMMGLHLQTLEMLIYLQYTSTFVQRGPSITTKLKKCGNHCFNRKKR
jgi:hypothetical protein